MSTQLHEDKSSTINGSNYDQYPDFELHQGLLDQDFGVFTIPQSILDEVEKSVPRPLGYAPLTDHLIDELLVEAKYLKFMRHWAFVSGDIRMAQISSRRANILKQIGDLERSKYVTTGAWGEDTERMVQVVVDVFIGALSESIAKLPTIPDGTMMAMLSSLRNSVPIMVVKTKKLIKEMKEKSDAIPV